MIIPASFRQSKPSTSNMVTTVEYLHTPLSKQSFFFFFFFKHNTALQILSWSTAYEFEDLCTLTFVKKTTEAQKKTQPGLFSMIIKFI